jgi:hypothetical protein
MSYQRLTQGLAGFAKAREQAFADILEPFSLASPELLLQRKLLRRADSKFVLRVDGLADILKHLRRDYALVRAGTQRIATYRTLYFDTADLQCFHAHRRGRRPRHKVRIRHYPDRHVSYFEIKTKKSDLITQKVRIDVPHGDDTLPDRAVDLVRAHGSFVTGSLEPQLWTNFRRLTLIGLETDERMTIDLELRVGRADALEELEGVAIAEVKQAAFGTHTPVMRVLRDAGLRPTSASKYCTAIALTRQGLALNRLLPALRVIRKVRT